MTRREAFSARGTRSTRLRRVASPTRAAVLVVVGLVLASLLTAPGLLETARRQPYGPARTVLLTGAEALADVSGATRLDVPWRTLDAWVLAQAPTAPPPTAPPTTEQPPGVTTPPEVPPGAPSEDATAQPAREPSAAPTQAPSTAPTAAVPTPGASDEVSRTPRVPTVERPLRVWIAGDSMWERPGPPLVEALEATGLVDVVELEFRYSTGLTRPDFFDWPAHAASQLARLDPEVVLFLVGPNDSQPLVEDGTRHEPGTDGFDVAYTARVRRMMELLAGQDRQALWVGLPIMRHDGFDERMQALDAAYAAAAGVVAGVDHVPTRTLFSDADGRYAEYLPGPDGTLLPMRNRDGVHLSAHGARRLAQALFDLLETRHHLERD